ncbi:cupin domain-containing protein [Streptomyces sp. NPDC059785]|uniref:cupin domain-containing protein n=1 Tax=Streptomyces sp. NPDC059785 TaxID=3346945 RepID=UPI00364A331C
MTPEDLVAHYGLEPIPREGGRFRQTWAGPERRDGRPEGTAIVALLTSAPDDFSALHRLPADETWHFYLGAPLDMLLLLPDGATRTVVLGPDVFAGQHIQYTVPAGTWMGARVAQSGASGEGGAGAWSFFGCTMAPGFIPEGYEHGVAAELIARYPDAAAHITELSRP